MRCPKCGYISFDHLDTCLKCNKDIKEASEALPGSVYNVTAPSFLKVTAGPPEDEIAEEMGGFAGADEDMDEMEFEDPDLDILVDDEAESDILLESEDDFAGDIAMQDTTDSVAGADSEFEITLEDGDDGEIGIDLGQFTDDIDDELSGFDETPAEEGEEAFSLGVPEELSDMSDLAPPAADDTKVAAAESDTGDDFSLDLDLDLGDEPKEPGEPQPALVEEEVASLSLDDLDFLEEEEQPAPTKKTAPGAVDMDDDLNFDLDLGGLSLDDK